MLVLMRLLIALLLSVSNCWAAIGSVTEQTGQPGEIARSKQKLAGSRGAEVESMDTIVTRGGAMNITFRDDTKVKVNENSRLLIDDFVYDPKTSDAGKLALKVGMGTVRYASGQIARVNPQQVAIKTPTASIAVRGTDFAMTVDESGQSLIVLVPSCRDDQRKKEYELEENTCRVGSIVVETLVGKVVLDQAFQATYVQRASDIPTRPVVLNTIEAKINNNLILVKPIEIVRAIKESNHKTKREEQEAEAEEQTRQLSQQVKEQGEEQTKKIIAQWSGSNNKPCDPYKKICVYWERDGTTQQERGKGVAVKLSDEHVAEVKTQGYGSNSNVVILQGDFIGSELIGSGDPGGNNILIKQTSGVLKQAK